MRDDLFWMQKALAQAQLAYMYDEVPVGVVIVRDNQLISCGYNQPVLTCDPTAHAEIVAIRKATHDLNNYRLPRSTLYSTLEPCAMCVGAIVHARITRLVFAATEPKSGAVVSQCYLADNYYNHRMSYTGGILAEASRAMLRQFFIAKRGKVS